MEKLAKQNQVASVKIMAKDLVRNRKYQTKFIEMKAQLQGVSLQLQTMKSQEAMTRAMKGVTKVMVSMNSKMNAPQVNKIMHDFMQENERMKLTEEMMGEAMDEAMDDDEEEEGAVVNQVLDEIGIEIGDALKPVQAGEIPQKQAEPAAAQAAPE